MISPTTPHRILPPLTYSHNQVRRKKCEDCKKAFCGEEGEIFITINDKCYCEVCATIHDPTPDDPVFEYVSRKYYVDIHKIIGKCQDSCSHTCRGIWELEGCHNTIKIQYFININVCEECRWYHRQGKLSKIVHPDYMRPIKELREFAKTLRYGLTANTKDKLIERIKKEVNSHNACIDIVSQCRYAVII